MDIVERLRIFGSEPDTGNAYHEAADLIESLRQQLLERDTCIERMRLALERELIGSCMCVTKTPEWKYHKPSCPYFIFSEALSTTPSPELLNRYCADVVRKVATIDVPPMSKLKIGFVADAIEKGEF